MTALIGEGKKPKVSVCVITYNQEKYIRQCLQSIVDQKTNFSFEVIVGDDCSLDGTRAVLCEFVDKYPNIVTPLFRDKNIGLMNNFFDVISVSNSKYIAFCEGDDYWTDPFKLQKQLEFMEENQDYSMCYHAVEVVDIFKNKTGRYLGPYKKGSRDYSMGYNVVGGRVHLSSIFMRTRYIEQGMPFWFLNAKHGDFALTLFLSASGRIYFIDELMSAYRTGVENSVITKMRNNYSKENEINYHKKRIETLESADKYYNYKFHNELEQVNLFSLVKILMLEGNKEELKKEKYKNFINRQGLLGKFKLILINKYPNIAKTLVKLKGMLVLILTRITGGR